jgi:hypothetical protein
VTDRAPSDCNNGTLTSEIGLDFDVYCDTKILGFDVADDTQLNLEACLQSCATRIASSPSDRCMAIQFNRNSSRCYYKTSSAGVSDLSSSEVSVTAFADPAPFENRGTACPFANETIQSDKNGMQYRILCETDASVFGFDSSDPDTQYKPFHADTAQDCLQYCSDHDPLCYGVVYTESLDWSYRNCFPKRANVTDRPEEYTWVERMTLAIGLLPVANTTCVPSIYVSSSVGTKFNISCDQNGAGPNLSRVRADNFEECMDTCAGYEAAFESSKCSSVVYEPNAKSGFLNCHLKGMLTNMTGDSDWRVAEVIDEGDGHGAGTNSEAGSIAGAVVGSVVGLLVLAGLIFWVWRRARSPKSNVQHVDDGTGSVVAKSQPKSDSAASHLLDESYLRKDIPAELPESERLQRPELPA